MRRPRRRNELPVQFPSYSSAAGDGLIQSLARRQPDWFYCDGAKSGRKAAWNTEQVAPHVTRVATVPDNANHHRITRLLAAAALDSIAAMIENIAGRIVYGAGGMHVNGTVKIVFRIARWILGEKEQYSWRWIIHRRRVPDGLIVVIRLGENNSSILDYLLVPTAGSDGDTIRFAEKHRGRLGIERFETSDALVRSVSRRVTKLSHTSPTKPAQSTKRSGRSKRTSRRVHA